MSDADRNELIDAYFDAMDAEDLARVRPVLADDFRYESLSGDLDGAAGLRRYVEERKALTDTTHRIDRRLHDAGGSVAEGVVTGATSDGEQTSADFCDVFEFDGDDERITRIAVYLNDA